MNSYKVTNALLLTIAVLILVLCIQNMYPQKVVIYQDGSPVGSGLRSTRSNAMPVIIVE